MVLERFTLVPGGGRGDYREETVCVSCWVGCDDENCIEPHGNAPWPCENARLRERVALLEGAAGCVVAAWGCGHLGVCRCMDDAVDGLRAALAQAGEGGAA